MSKKLFLIDLIESCFYKCISDQLAQWNFEIQYHVEINSLIENMQALYTSQKYTLEKYINIYFCRALTPSYFSKHWWLYTREAFRPPYIPDNCQSHQSRRECKKFHVRGIFSYWTRKGPLWNSVQFTHICNILCVILHTLCNFTHSV